MKIVTESSKENIWEFKREVEDRIKCNIHLTGVPEERRGRGDFLDKVMSEICPELIISFVILPNTFPLKFFSIKILSRRPYNFTTAYKISWWWPLFFGYKLCKKAISISYSFTEGLMDLNMGASCVSFGLDGRCGTVGRLGFRIRLHCLSIHLVRSAKSSLKCIFLIDWE